MSNLGAQKQDPAEIRRLVFLFALAYFAQGLGQHSGLISQPLKFYLKEGLGLNPAQVSEYLSILVIPWMIKPIYGLVTDYIPLLGYRRKAWLFLVNLLAASAFLWLTGLTDVGTIIIALVLTAFGTAASDVIIDALMVEHGERTGQIARFQGIQWLWFKVAAILTALAGGYLASIFEPATALHVAATITMLAPISVITASYFVVKEQPSTLTLEHARETTRSVIAAFKSAEIRIALAFLVLWCFSPGFGDPLYFHMVDRLEFDQKFIGQLNALTATGAVVGAFLFARYLSRQAVHQRAVIAVIAAVSGILAYMMLAQPSAHAATLAGPLNAYVGMVNQIGTLTVFALAASACPPRAAGFTFALLMSVYNGVEQLSSVIGSRLYNDVFDKAFEPLLWVAAGSLLCCLALIPMLRRLQPAPAAS
jgi:hypothetical protein